MVVLVKQVPDTTKVTGKAMNDDGTINRGALPTIFNPEDLNALELALQIKESFGGKITVVTMGPPTAADVLRQSLYRGADDAILISDMRGAASDTLATSYILSCAVKKLGFDIVICGHQAIDGDTAQVGPQLAEKLNITQATYVEEFLGIEDGSVIVKRNIGSGWQKVSAKLPVLMTALGTVNEPRVAAAKSMMVYKNAKTRLEVQATVTSDNPDADETVIKDLTKRKCQQLEDKNLLIKLWDLDYLEADLSWCGRNGSPTKVHRIQSVVLSAKQSKDIAATDEAIDEMIHELIKDNTIA